MLSEVFETKVAAFLVATGTAANALALSALARPWEAVFCHEEAHIHDDECCAPEFFTGGAKLIGIPGEGGKLTPEALGETLERFPRGLVKSAQPGALSLSQATEAGTIYSVDEIAALSDARPRRRGEDAHGRRALRQCARFPRRLAGRHDLARGRSTRCRSGRPRTARSPARRSSSSIRRARRTSPTCASARGHTLSKGRFLGAQMEAYLTGGLWLRLAGRANAAARRLSGRLVGCAGDPDRLADRGQRGVRRRARRDGRGLARGRRRVPSLEHARARAPSGRRAPARPWCDW